jgi:hypothetical protein
MEKYYIHHLESNCAFQLGPNEDIEQFMSFNYGCEELTFEQYVDVCKKYYPRPRVKRSS